MQAQIFAIVVVAIEPIEAGDELYLLCYFGPFYSNRHHSLFMAARKSHWIHKYLCTLEDHLYQVGKLDPSFATVNSILSYRNSNNLIKSVASDNAIQQVQYAELDDEDEQMLKLCMYDYIFDEDINNSKSNKGMKPLTDIKVALQRTNCTYIKSNKIIDNSRFSNKTRIELKASQGKLPRSTTVRKPNRELSTSINNKEAIYKLIDNGYDCSAVTICEINSLYNPVRYFTVPSQISHGLMALRDIKCGETIFTYTGDLCEQLDDIQNNSGLYVYALSPDIVARSVRNYCVQNVIYIDALKFGNIARFMNDNRFRRNELINDGCSCNTFFMHVCKDNIIHLLFGCNRAVKPGEELITSYGDQYWKSIQPTLINHHLNYQQYAVNYMRVLQEKCVEAGLTLPQKPHYAVETYPLFNQYNKILPYPEPITQGQSIFNCYNQNKSNFNSTNSNNSKISMRSYRNSIENNASYNHFADRYEVEEIVGKRKKNNKMIYRVKWKGYSMNDCTWQSEEDLVGAQDLVDQFNQQFPVSL
jgi:hypothetical protein